jgi:hypothetical protein
MTKRDLEIGRLLYPETDYYKPKTRAECVDGARRAPTFLQVSPVHRRLAADGRHQAELPRSRGVGAAESCALDVADRGAPRWRTWERS